MKRTGFFCELPVDDVAKIRRWAKVGKIPQHEVISAALAGLGHTPAFARPTVVMVSGGGVAAVGGNGKFKRGVGAK